MNLAFFIFIFGTVNRQIATTLPWSTGPDRLFVRQAQTPSIVSRTPHSVPAKFASARSPVAPDQVTYMTSDLDELTKIANLPQNHEFEKKLGVADADIARGDDADGEKGLAGCLKLHPELDSVALYLAEEMVKREDWDDAERVLVRPNRNRNETNYEYLEAAVLAHQGYVFEGERAALLDRAGIALDPNGQRAAGLRMMGKQLPAPAAPGKWIAIVLSRYPSESPSDIEAIAWFLGAGSLSGQGGMQGRAVAYAARSLAMFPDDPAMLAATAEGLDAVGRYGDAIALLKPYLQKYGQSRDPETRSDVVSPYQTALIGLRNKQPTGP